LATLTVDAAVVAVVAVVVAAAVAVAVAVVAVAVAVVAAGGVVVVVVAVVAVVAVFASDKSCGTLHLKQEGQIIRLTQPGKVIVLCALWKFRHSRDNFLF
jgi:hypothetical protein